MTENKASMTTKRQIEDLVMRIEGEFLETPGLMLTVAEAQRRFGMDEITCEAVLDALVDSGSCSRRATASTGASIRA